MLTKKLELMRLRLEIQRNWGRMSETGQGTIAKANIHLFWFSKELILKTPGLHTCYDYHYPPLQPFATQFATAYPSCTLDPNLTSSNGYRIIIKSLNYQRRLPRCQS